MLRVGQATSKTDTGRQRRENEDSAYARSPLFVVADGMGGAQAGEVASRLAVEAFQEGLGDGGSPEERLAERARDANRRIYEISRSEHERAGMGTTLTAAYVDGGGLAIAHVGDSRAYLLRDGTLNRLTRDHSLVEELVERGKLTEEQAAEHPQRSIITRALGVDPDVDVDTRTFAVRAGDVVLLCSDGLTSMVSEKRIAEVLAAMPDLEEAGERLIAEANQAGGRDNITVVAFRIEDASAAAGAEEQTVAGLGDHPTLADEAATPDADSPGAAEARAATATLTATRSRAPAAPARRPAATVPRARLHGSRQPPRQRLRRRRWLRPLGGLAVVLVILTLAAGGAYLAARQVYFIGTNAQGIVTVYRGFPYDLPFGIHLYRPFYVSGAPLAMVPAARRTELLDDQLRSRSDALGLAHAAELGQLSG